MTKIVALILIIGAMSGADAYGCSCKADTRALAEIVRSNISESDYVGVYEVDKTVSGKRKFAQVELKGRWVRLILVESIKGAPPEAFGTAPGRFIRSNCDVRLTTGELLLVYGRDSEPVRLTLCSASGKLKNRLPELRVIFELQKIEEHP